MPRRSSQQQPIPSYNNSSNSNCNNSTNCSNSSTNICYSNITNKLSICSNSINRP